MAVALSAREEVLRRIRTGLAAGGSDAAPAHAGPPDGNVPPAPLADATPDELVALFAERVADYRAEVIRDDDVAGAVRTACARHGARALVHAPGVPDAWRPPELAWSTEPLSVTDLDAADGVLTAAATAIAETGTIVLDHTPDQGRRALTLVPDLHLCVVDAAQVVATVPDALVRLRAAVVHGRPLTFVSGPSATSDIELERVEGVHGPRRLVVILVS